MDIRSEIGPATINPSGDIAVARLLSNVMTLPCMEGSTAAWTIAFNGPLARGIHTPTMKIPAIAIGSNVPGVRPITANPIAR